MAGAIAELANRAIASDFHNIDPRSTRVILVEAGQRLLKTFDPSLSVLALQSLQQLGVEVRLGAVVTGCSCAAVFLGDERIETRTIMWAAGVKASPAGAWLGVDTDRVGRVRVGADLSVPGHPNIFVIGDTALAMGVDGEPLPGVAPVAKQQGKYVADVLRARMKARPTESFRYRNNGSMATIGRKSAVAEFGGIKLSGFSAWLLWCLVHVYFLIGFRNRFSVALNWSWNYITFQRGSRLITGISGSRIEDVTRENTIDDSTRLQEAV